MYQGILIVAKEAGFTSHDVVAKLRGICGQKKIGHTGTLDPAAVGVLPVALGSATRLCDMLAEKDKEYVADLLLGVRTDTQDMTGRVLETREAAVSEEAVRSAVMSFQGEILQVPPMYSALKVNGKKLYELARAGREVERKARPVSVYEIGILKLELPRVRLRVRCSKGTYIRTLCEDIGAKLGCGGAMEALVRTRVGAFRLEDALTLDQIQSLRDEGRLQEAVLPVEACFPGLPKVRIKEAYRKLLENGNPFAPDCAEEEAGAADADAAEDGAADGAAVSGQVLAYCGNRFYGVYAYDPVRGQYRAVKMFL